MSLDKIIAELTAARDAAREEYERLDRALEALGSRHTGRVEASQLTGSELRPLALTPSREPDAPERNARGRPRSGVQERAAALVRRAVEELPAGQFDQRALLAKCSELAGCEMQKPTVKPHLLALVREGVVIATGTTSGRVYERAQVAGQSPIADSQEAVGTPTRPKVPKRAAKVADSYREFRSTISTKGEGQS